MRRIVLPIFLLAAGATTAAARQTVTVAPRVRAYTMSRDDDNDRAMLGVSTSSSGKRDTLGLLVESVTPGSPAEKAGIEEGNRIASINGVSLKLAREDAGDEDMASTMTNRLVREMRKLKAGDEASLELWTGAHYKTVKVKTVSAEALTPERASRADREDRPVLGVSLGSSGSKRDTLGVFVSSVTDNGPADKAGIAEGDRIASVNGVDLRTPKEDVGDMSVANSKVSRLQREVAKLKAGQTVDLSIVEGGRTRTVKVTLGRARDLDHSNGFSFSRSDGSDGFMVMPRTPMAPMPPMPAMAPMAPMAPMPPSFPRSRVRVFGGDGDDDVADVRLDGLRESLRDLGPRIRAELDRELPRVREDLDREMPRIRDELDREMPRIRDELDREMPRLRDQLDRMRIEMPLMRKRALRGVII